jgi:hypothetical protein
MGKIEFMRWYHQVGRDTAEAVAEFYGVPLTQVAKWEAEVGTKTGPYDTYYSAARKIEARHAT